MLQHQHYGIKIFNIGSTIIIQCKTRNVVENPQLDIYQQKAKPTPIQNITYEHTSAFAFQLANYLARVNQLHLTKKCYSCVVYSIAYAHKQTRFYFLRQAFFNTNLSKKVNKASTRYRANYTLQLLAYLIRLHIYILTIFAKLQSIFFSCIHPNRTPNFGKIKSNQHISLRL